MIKELLPANAFESMWSTLGSEGRSPAPDRILSSLSRLARLEAEPAVRLQGILDRMLEVTQAERIFFFEASAPTAGEPPALGACTASSNIDHEEIRDPEAKVPVALIKEVLASGQAILIEDAEADERWRKLDPSARPRARGLGAVPLSAAGKPVGVVFFDHRFRPIVLTPAAGTELVTLCHTLGFLRHLERLEGENRSLWHDIARLKESRGAAPDRVEGPGALPASAGSPRNPPRPRPDRSHLRGDYSLIVGSSPRMLEIFQLLDRISGSNAPVLINGESGTGKELIANAIHKNSPRSGKPFVSENCGALTETLLESELFGYVKGAFTGAGKDHKGLFELADSGSLFLDEVGDMSPGMQKKLLRVLQEGVIRRVGGKDMIHVSVRLICATNKDLLQECKQGRFREDLYYRLNVINIRMPALRDRKEDIPEIVEHFLGELASQMGAQKTVEPAALQRMMQHSWPGNIRELQNEVKRLYALSDGMIRVSDLSEVILQGEGRDLLHTGIEKELGDLTLREATEKLEREMIRWALISTRGNKSMVAKKLQIPKTSLYNKINKYQLDKDLPG